jgi:predicted Rossmann fold flavoprotein
MHFDVIVIGGGAAGLFCAIEAGKRGRKVLVVEHNAEVGRKIVISGGGRCNFTNTGTRPENFVSRNPHFAKSALARYTPEEFVRLVRRHGIEYYEKKLGQLFCRTSSRQIVDMLVHECRYVRVRVQTGCTVSAVRKNDLFEVQTSSGKFSSKSLVIASGGLSFPKIGATDLGYRVARQFGLDIVQTRPSLVPLVFADGKGLGKLAGVSVDVLAEAGGRAFRDNILFTHRGLSGPATLQISNYWEKDEDVLIDLMPEYDAAELLRTARGGKQQTGNFLSRILPARFVESYIPQNLATKTQADLSRRDTEVLSELLKNWRVRFRETEGWHKAEVTLGGVSTSELSSQTMETKRVPGLYFIGEVVDVTGWLGGYNFQWAWASGYAAGQAV